MSSSVLILLYLPPQLTELEFSGTQVPKDAFNQFPPHLTKLYLAMNFFEHPDEFAPTLDILLSRCKELQSFTPYMAMGTKQEGIIHPIASRCTSIQ